MPFTPKASRGTRAGRPQIRWASARTSPLPDACGPLPEAVGNLAACRDAEFEQRLDASAASLEGGHQFPARHPPQIDEGGYRNSVLLAEGLEPPAPGIVKMHRDRANRTPWCSRNGSIPEPHWEVPDEVDGNAVIRPPSSEEGRPQIRGGRHSCSTLVSRADACSSWMVRMSMWRFYPDHSKRLNSCAGMAPDD